MIICLFSTEIDESVAKFCMATPNLLRSGGLLPLGHVTDFRPCLSAEGEFERACPHTVDIVLGAGTQQCVRSSKPSKACYGGVSLRLSSFADGIELADPSSELFVLAHSVA